MKTENNLTSYKIVFLVRSITSQNQIQRLYAKELELPFVPAVGMKFVQGTNLWETEDGELSPEIERVIFDLDDSKHVCLFTITKRLSSSFWQELDINKHGTYADHYFFHV
jgi:hypothetical protein